MSVVSRAPCIFGLSFKPQPYEKNRSHVRTDLRSNYFCDVHHYRAPVQEWGPHYGQRRNRRLLYDGHQLVADLFWNKIVSRPVSEWDHNIR